MCGIAGELWYGGDAPADADAVRRMAAALAHRGPDGDGLRVDGPLALGHRRLAIIDPAGGQQPMSNEDGTIWVAFNGTVYNAPELRAALTAAGHRFRTRSDTEVIVHAYEAYGEAAFTRLNGMFAIALWDAPRRRLLLARDPFGIKPLYLWDDGRRLRFASELKAFGTDPAFPRDLDLAALDLYLSLGFVPSPRTLFAAVRKLPPGHCLRAADGRIAVQALPWPVPAPPARCDSDAAEAALQVELVASVRRHLLSDVPVGALLSGGIDSAAVVAVMRAERGRFPTFSVGFGGAFAHDESAAAQRSALLLDTEHHALVLDAATCADALGDTAWHLDEPIATPSALALYHLGRLAAAHVKVVLTGQGADEPWAGYRRHRGERLGRWYRRLPRPLRTGLLEPAALQLRDERLRRAVAALGEDDCAARWAGLLAPFAPAARRAIRPAAGGAAADAVRYWQAPVAHLPPLAQQCYVDARFSLADDLLLYGDKLTMAWGLEARVPWLDHGLMALVENLPDELRLRGWGGHKHLWRQALRAWVPAEIARRPKIGFLTPMTEWLRGPWAPLARERFTAARSGVAQYCDAAVVRTLCDEHAAGRVHTRALFALLMFDCWHEQFVARPREMPG